jgi:glycosyltransferase A (GT-A) superfamily protein (DUF2064 family)
MVFSLSAEREFERKPFSGLKNPASSIALINQCISNTRAVAEASGLDVLWFDESRQFGNSFGERYANAVLSCFQQGYENVISIGNDSPSLTVDFVRLATEKLTRNNVVLGPAEDGGIYLLGISEADFDYESFSKLPWQTDSLFARISSEISSESTYCLETLVDLDDYEAALAYAFRCPKTRIGRLILASYCFVSERCKTSYTPPPFLQRIKPSILPFRGPPTTFSH